MAVPDAYNASGSTIHVNFFTSKETALEDGPQALSHNWVICEGSWEAEFCRVVEAHPRVRAYVKNQGSGAGSALSARRDQAHLHP